MSPTSLAPGFRSSSAASTPVACRRRRARISPTRATTSGGSCTRRVSRPACTRRVSSSELLEEGIRDTSAAYRTTPGSGDLRRGDFAGSGARLQAQIARDLEPGGSRSSARRPTAAPSASGPSSASSSAGSATRGSSCCRRRHRRTRPCRGSSGCAGSRSSRAAPRGCRSEPGFAGSSSPGGGPDRLLFRYGNGLRDVVDLAGRRRGGGPRRTSKRYAGSSAKSAASWSFGLGPLLWERERWGLDEPRVRQDGAAHLSRPRTGVRERRSST